MGEFARSYCEELLIWDLETNWSDSLGKETFDYVIAADVIEHLRDPLKCLTMIKKFLSNDSQLLISLPNIAYGGIIAALFCGQFPYADKGILDETHLRFFTKDSMFPCLEILDVQFNLSNQLICQPPMMKLRKQINGNRLELSQRRLLLKSR